MKPRHSITLFLLMILVASCSTAKKTSDLIYFNDLTEIDSGVLKSLKHNLTLQPDDELSISVSSEVPEATRHFNLTTADMSNTSNLLTTNRMQQTYIVNKNGDIDFPVLGLIHVEGMTTTELKNYLVERISKTVKDPMIKVTLVNFRVNVIGEVNKPQVYSPNSERLTILEALAGCEDLTEYADRHNVRVIRERPDGVIEHARLDLQDSKLTSSPYYYLQQNDVVIVSPNQTKEENSKYKENTGNRISLLAAVISGITSVATILVTLLRK